LVGLLLLGLTAHGAEPKHAEPAPEKRYVGSRACLDCHEEQYQRFVKSAKKAQSFLAVEKMQKKLTFQELQGCYRCHTTGYGQPGGFVSLEATPDLAHAGCEVCHGPGSVHAETRRKADVRRAPQLEVCEGCHVASRVKAFSYRPVIHAGAH
jgi:hypothetical protein